MDSDLQLFADWAQGDQRAGERLFERHYEGVARFFRNKAGDHWPELCQRTFLTCVEVRDKFRAEGSFRSFLFGIAYRQLYRFFRERARDPESVDFQLRSVQDFDPSLSSVVAANQEERLLLAALRRIPLEYQVILELHYWEDMTAKACAEVLDVPLGTAKTRLRRGRQLLEAELAKDAPSEEVLTRTLSDLEGWARRLREQLDH
ncbi:sigma-70 family RNA polymerase sigma factor [Pseudenhygromyxa sp. WMMC2535]|uniref:RNA polymerase sigma factor n=1 Tax=Pseudenhygromyxa sp. WMMC2535 TaxID=2712867 RepID=UPI0015567B06|nr:sigma-70 family RNA polymerase sigma factor [Pseudenhygromyxa sp. WMMC2535]NVB43170.1 sigma-70 family RNA polymerase sigma factor [Pseudenhygromyxa sp. WMMC2535]